MLFQRSYFTIKIMGISSNTWGCVCPVQTNTHSYNQCPPPVTATSPNTKKTAPSKTSKHLIVKTAKHTAYCQCSAKNRCFTLKTHSIFPVSDWVFQMSPENLSFETMQINLELKQLYSFNCVFIVVYLFCALFSLTRFCPKCCFE